MTWLNRTMLLVAVAGLLLSLAPPSALAQDDEAGWSNVRVIEVRPDKAAEWEQLQQQRNEAIKKAGLTGREIWKVVRGDVDTYYIVTRVSKLGGNDEPPPDPLGVAGFQQWISRVNQCVGDRQVLTLRRMPALSIPAKEGRKPNLAILRLRTNGPGQRQPYTAYLRDDYIPALKKAKVDGVYVSRIFAGDSVRTWAVVTLVDNWAAFDEPNPLTKALGQAEAGKLIQKGARMIEQNETILLQYRADLSAR